MTEDQGYSHERELGRRIAQLREGAGLTQRELARRMDLTQSALSRIESGQRRLSAAQVSQLARILAIDPGFLLQAEPSGAGEPYAAEALQSSREGWNEPTEPRSNARALRAEGVRGLDADLHAGLDAGTAGPNGWRRWARRRWARRQRWRACRAATRRRPRAPRGSSRRRRARSAAAPPAQDVPRGRARPRALEPPVFAEVVRDALEVEALVSRPWQVPVANRT